MTGHVIGSADVWQMMRYRGKFGRSFYPDLVVYPSDTGKVLEDKWARWHELESWKRSVLPPTLAGLTSLTCPV